MDKLSVEFLNTKIEFTSKEQAAELLRTSDEFTRSMSPFDFAAKTQDKEKTEEQDYLDHAALQANSWSEKEISDTKEMIKKAEEKIIALNLNINLPAQVKLILSSCLEEGGAEGYTRENYIVFRTKPSESLFLHEMWHIISRANPELRDEAYKIIGFEKIDRISFPPVLNKLRITNPDAPFIEHSIKATADGQERDLILCTMASSPYTKGSFFQYLMIIMYEVKFENGKAEIIISPPYNVANVTGFRDKIGNNTNYIIHPEEITAEHFTLVVQGKTSKSQDKLDELRDLLQK